MIEPPAELRAEPAASLAVPVSPERSKWRTALVAYASIVGLCLAILPPLVRRNLTAPEPMDADGSAEVADRYERHRRLRVLGLFRAYGVLLPAMLGAGFTVKVWFPGLESLATVLVGCGGVLIGVGFGILGSLLMVERARIVETLVRIGRTDAAMST